MANSIVGRRLFFRSDRIVDEDILIVKTHNQTKGNETSKTFILFERNALKAIW